MTGSSSSYTSTSSSGMITGTFAAVEYAQNVLATYDKVLMDALKQAAKEETARIQKTARSEGSIWKEVADNLEVVYDHDNRQFTYTLSGDESVQRKAAGFEYGDMDQAPQPLLRSGALQGQYDLERNINDTLRTGLMEGF